MRPGELVAAASTDPAANPEGARLTLHDAMEKVLLEAGRPLSARELSGQLNTAGLYRKRDGSPVQPGQVSARARKYPRLFTQASGVIGLASWGEVRLARPAGPTSRAADRLTEPDAKPGTSAIRSSALPTALLDPTAFRAARTIDREVPDYPGLYAVRIRDTAALPHPFRGHLEKRGHDLLYIGIARRSLSIRLLGQELRGRGHGTFFRSIGAILGYRPPAGSLVGKSNTRNYTFAPTDKRGIIEWIDANLLVNWVKFSGAHAVEESALIRERLPLLNLQGNTAALPELSAARAECVRIANLTAG